MASAQSLFDVESVLSRPFWRVSWPVLWEDFANRSEPVVLGHLADEAPEKTGALKGSFYASRSLGKIEFRSHELYAGFVVRGTKPHTISAVNASALHFFAADGSEIFAQSVQHPGTQPNPFNQRAMDKARGELASAWRRAAVLSIR